MADSAEPTGPRSDGITYQQLLDTDPYPVPDVLRVESPRYPRQRRRARLALHVA